MSAAASGLHICTAWHFKLCMCHGMVCTLYIIIYACSGILYNHLLQAAIHQHDTYTMSGATICDLHNTGCVYMFCRPQQQYKPMQSCLRQRRSWHSSAKKRQSRQPLTSR